MQRIIIGISRQMQRFLDGFLALLLAVLICDVLLGVVSRYVFGAQVEWTEELACYLLVWTGIVGAAAAFAQKKHLGLDVFVSSFSESARRKTAIISDSICLLFTSIVFLYGGIILTVQAFKIYRVLPALQLPDGFVFLALPVAGVFMAVFQIESLLQSLYGNSVSADSPKQITTLSAQGGQK